MPSAAAGMEHFQDIKGSRHTRDVRAVPTTPHAGPAERPTGSSSRIREGSGGGLPGHMRHLRQHEGLGSQSQGGVKQASREG